MSKIVKIQKKIHIPKNTYRKNGKVITVKAHDRIITVNKKEISKEEYLNEFEKRPFQDQKRDKSRTLKRNLVRGNTALINPNDNSSTIDWLGVDAKGFQLPPKNSTQSVLFKGLPNGYEIHKYKIGNSIKYRPKFKGINIGQTTLHTSYQNALNQVKTHKGRLDGSIKNISVEDRFEADMHRVSRFKGEEYGDTIRNDKDLFDSSQLDDDLYYSEKIGEFNKKFYMSNSENWHHM
jgi:hypothetical protein